jgi:hypothetical protein
MPSSRPTTSRGEVAFARESPEPSTTRGAIPNCVTAERTTRAPATVVPAVPNRAPSSFTSVSA